VRLRLPRGWRQVGHRAAALLGATGLPWTPRTVSPKISFIDRLAMGAFDRFARVSITVGRLRFVLPNGGGAGLRSS